MHLPTRVTSMRPALSSSLRWCERVAALTSCVSCRALQGKRRVGAADLLEDLIAARLGERARDLRELLVG